MDDRLQKPFKITVTKLTDASLLHKANEATMRNERTSKQSLLHAYTSRHSPIRTQIFWVDMQDIPTFVSTHLVRHKIGVEHFVGSNRPDLGGDENADRWTPINHSMLINADSLINMASSRLCNKCSYQTRSVLRMIRRRVGLVDDALMQCMERKCEQLRYCPEPRQCVQCKGKIKKHPRLLE